MHDDYWGKKINKAIGLTLVDLSKEEIYAKRGVFSMEAKRLFNPKLYKVEKVKVKLKNF